jgi:hypothetical protein
MAKKGARYETDGSFRTMTKKQEGGKYHEEDRKKSI